MSRQVVFRRAAREEFEDAVVWYDAQRQGLGEEFLTQLDEAIEGIARHPQRYPIVLGNVRRAVLRRFPYAIYFRERVDAVVILAVFHGRRNPLMWKRRSS